MDDPPWQALHLKKKMYINWKKSSKIDSSLTEPSASQCEQRRSLCWHCEDHPGSHCTCGGTWWKKHYTTDLDHCLRNLGYPIDCKSGHQVVPLALITIWPAGGYTCIDGKFGQHVAEFCPAMGLATSIISVIKFNVSACLGKFDVKYCMATNNRA